MSKYPLIESMGLKAFYNYDSDEDVWFVDADQLEKALRDAPVVYGVPNGNWCDEKDKESCDNNKARLVCIQPLKKKTKAEAAIELLEEYDAMLKFREKDKFNTVDANTLQTDIKKVLEIK